jgi:hypothetical protein
MIHTCTECRLRYESDYHRPGLCTACWVVSRGYTDGKITKGLLSQIELLADELGTVEMRAELAEKQLLRRPASGGLGQDRIRQMIGLCHPDRHQNSKTSTEVTQWLLSQRLKT